MATRPLTTAQLQAALKTAQDALAESRKLAADTEATARKQLAEAADVVSRLKLTATAASDNALKATRALDEMRQSHAALQDKLLIQQALLRESAPSADALMAKIQLLQSQVDGLLAENQRLADQRDTAQTDSATLFQRLDQSSVREKEAVAKAVQAATAAQQNQTQLVEEKLRLGTARIAALSAQLGASGKLEVLAPDQVGQLMGGFLQQLETGMPTLRLAEGELKLKLGLARSDQHDGFVILPPNASAELRSSLHEVSLRFDRAGATVLKTDVAPK